MPAQKYMKSLTSGRVHVFNKVLYKHRKPDFVLGIMVDGKFRADPEDFETVEDASVVARPVPVPEFNDPVNEPVAAESESPPAEVADADSDEPDDIPDDHPMLALEKSEIDDLCAKNFGKALNRRRSKKNMIKDYLAIEAEAATEPAE